MAKIKKKELDCLLTIEEKGKIGIEACEARDKARELKEEAAALEKVAKAKEHEVARGKARRMVECIEIPIFDQNSVRIERTDAADQWPDGNNIVGERAMDGDERQMLIDVDGGKVAPKNDTDADSDEPEGDEPPKIVVAAPKGRTKKPK